MECVGKELRVGVRLRGLMTMPALRRIAELLRDDGGAPAGETGDLGELSSKELRFGREAMFDSSSFTSSTLALSGPRLTDYPSEAVLAIRGP